jgi:hypothetical protein
MKYRVIEIVKRSTVALDRYFQIERRYSFWPWWCVMRNVIGPISFYSKDAAIGYINREIQNKEYVEEHKKTLTETRTIHEV